MSVHITALEAEGFKRLKAVSLKPTAKGLTVIGGKNGSGKTSILDAIVYALGGEKYRPSEAKNRDSKKPPAIKIELSNGLVVERKGPKSSLKITDPGGLSGGQGVLDKFVERLALDLPKFMGATPKQKAEILLKITGAGDRLEELDAKEAVLYADRHDAGFKADEAESQLEGMEYFKDAPEEMVSVADLLFKIEEADEIRCEKESLVRQEEDKRAIASRIKTRIKGFRDETRAIEEEISGLIEEVDSLTIGHVELAKQAEAIRVPGVEPLKAEVAGAEEVNAQVRANAAHAEKATEAEEKRTIHNKLDRAIIKVRADRKKLLNDAKMPLDGLSFLDGELVYKGAPWDGMSSAEQLTVATSIVKQLNPECGFVLIDKLETMGVDTMNEFGVWAEAQGLQIIATRVSTGDECCIVIEDGRLKTAS